MKRLTEYGRLTRVLVKHVREAFVSREVIAAQWKGLKFSAPPDFTRALAEYDAFLEIMAGTGADVLQLPRHDALTLDSIYTRDASVLNPDGLVLCRMGKVQRGGEPDAQAQELQRRGVPIAGHIASPGLLEGGDLIWLDPATVVVGQGRRTNLEGIGQLKSLIGESVELIVVSLPDWPGANDVMHLMSLVSPVDADLAVVYSPLLPTMFRDELLSRGYRLVEVPDEEFETMGTNVLALGPRECLLLKGNPRTRAALEREHTQVREYEGTEISLKGGGGPTCLTRPLARLG